MTEHEDWTPEPIDAVEFHRQGRANINGAPYDRVAGVLYKRKAHIKRICYQPLDPAPDILPTRDILPAPEVSQGFQGEGSAVVRWLFSEWADTAEHLLEGRRFAFLQDVQLSPGARTGQRRTEGVDTILVVLSGEGQLWHRPERGAPMIVRPLRPGDAALIEGTSYYSVVNVDAQRPLRFLRLGLFSDHPACGGTAAASDAEPQGSG